VGKMDGMGFSIPSTNSDDIGFWHIAQLGSNQSEKLINHSKAGRVLKHLIIELKIKLLEFLEVKPFFLEIDLNFKII
jgi:hypothetical protein